MTPEGLKKGRELLNRIQELEATSNRIEGCDYFMSIKAGNYNNVILTPEVKALVEMVMLANLEHEIKRLRAEFEVL